MPTIDQAKIRESPPAKYWRPNHWAMPPSSKPAHTRRGDWKCWSEKCDTVKNARLENAGV